MLVPGDAMPRDVTILVGTTKGVFLIGSDTQRIHWDIEGPHCDLWPINHVIGDRASGYLWAAGGSSWHGAGVWRSTNGGSTWGLCKLADGDVDTWRSNNPEIAEQLGLTTTRPGPFTGSFNSVWSLGRSKNTLYAGTRPATLLRSRDHGETWEKVHGLTDHPSAPDWTPGGAGLTLHTIVSHPEDTQKLWVGISAAGVFATEDGGETWERRNRRDNSEIHANLEHPASGSETEIGHCVHNMVRSSGGGDHLYQQNHHGVFRSSDGGRTWQDITNGLPSTFGFPITTHPRKAQTAWTMPLNGDSRGRFPLEGRAAVWKTEDGGATWVACRTGLPQDACYFTVLRQAMASDTCDTPGVYFGTNSGSVFASSDEGANWQEIARHLPTVLSVEVLS